MHVIVVGGGGRLGSALGRECDRRGVGWDAKQADEPWPGPGPDTVVFDAGSPSGLAASISFCRKNRLGLVYAVTGLPRADRAALSDLGAAVPVVLAPNLSIGHWLQVRVVGWLARTLDTAAVAAEVAVTDRHPRTKQHRPSASATELAAAWTQIAGDQPEVVSIRAGQPVSEHAVQVDLSAFESMTVSHDVRDLRAVVDGAFLAMDWVGRAGPGLRDFTGLLDDLLVSA